MARERRHQINARLSDDEAARIEALAGRVHAQTGLKLRQVDVVRAGIEALERRYPAEQDPKPQKRGKQ